MFFNNNYLAADLGASNGRIVVGKYNGETISLEVIHKFINGGVKVNNNFHWDVLGQFSEIKKGIKKAVKKNYKINSIGVDTWGVDYALIDKSGTLMSNPYHYRDKRTDGVLEEIFNKFSKEKVYVKTGNQFIQFNTLFQLYIEKKKRPWILENASDLLFIPDLMNYFLTGEKFNEQTISSTSQLFNPIKNAWAKEVFNQFDLNYKVMQKIKNPTTKIGSILKNIKRECGINNKLSVIAVGSHDTASAVAAVPITSQDSAYLSSGTWSLLGVELEKPVINKESLNNNFTNEIGLENKIRFLKNLTGLWLIQECKKIWNKENTSLDYNQITEAAKKAEPYLFRIDPDHHDFLNPENMVEAIKDYCKKTKQYVPETIGEIARGIYESLSFKYAEVIKELENLTNKKIKYINIVGGGSRADLLCQYTANISRKQVIAGPVEATAAGNILAQLIAAGEIKNLKEGRQLIKNSFELLKYYPE
ncbi:MAG: rhamnulokinase [Bacillota bacterium]